MRRVIWLALITGCGGAPFTFVGDVEKGDADVFPETGAATVGVDGGSVGWDAQQDRKPDYDGLSESTETSQAADARGEDAPSEAQSSVDAGWPLDSSVLDGPVDHGEAAVDAITEAATEAGPEACTPPAAFTFGCGPPIYVDAPTQYCVLNQGPDTAQVMSNPCACEYDCACLLASGARLCPGGETYQNCSIGTTGGMVVVCR